MKRNRVKISISRPDAPPACLYVEIVAADMASLGRERPVVFILPGGPGADHTAYQSYACLKDAADLIFHDPRGVGRSDPGENSSYSMNNYINDVESIRLHLSLGKIIVLGKSYGAMCALGYAIRYQDAVARLILSAGAPSARFLSTAKKNIQRIGTPEQVRLCEKLWAGAFKSRDDILEYFRATNTLYSIRARAHPEGVDLVRKSRQFSYEVLNEGFRQAFWNFDYESELARLLCPTLILAGRQDWITDVKYSEYMAARIPYSQLRIFENASHAMEADAAEEYFQAIRDFIRSSR